MLKVTHFCMTSVVFVTSKVCFPSLFAFFKYLPVFNYLGFVTEERLCCVI